VHEVMSAGTALICDMVLLELWVGARGLTEQDTIRQIEANVPSMPIDLQVWLKARALARTCRAAGTTVPTPDLIIAACADHHGVELLERDAHFAKIAAARKKRASK